MAARTLIKTSLAVAAAAAAGSAVTAPAGRWYRRLRKPPWQPPQQAFPIVWTALYGLLAVAGARAIDATEGAERRAFIGSFGTNLALNAGWTAVFFGAQRPAAALAEIGALNVSNADLLRRAWAADRVAGVCVAPYVAWTAFATALNADIVRRNR